MKYKNAYLSNFRIFFTLYMYADDQLDNRAELFVNAEVDEFSLLLNGRIYVATKGGMTYNTRD